MPSYLVYEILKKHSNANNPLSRDEIRNYLEADYKIKVESNDTITKDLKEIGYTNWGDLESSLKSGNNIYNVIKKGNQGFFILADDNFNLGETTLLLNSIMSNSSLHEKDVNVLKSKVILVSNSPRNHLDLNKLAKINASLRKNSTHQVLSNLTKIAEALAKKKDIQFTHKLAVSKTIEGVGIIKDNLAEVHNLTMAPYYILYKNNKVIVIGSMYNNDYIEDNPESKNNKKYIMYVANLENMFDVKILSEEKQTPLKFYDDFNESIFLNSQSHIFEGEFKLKHYLGIKKFLVEFEKIEDFNDLYNFFGLNIKKIQRCNQSYVATIEAFASDVNIFVVSVNDFINRYSIRINDYVFLNSSNEDIHTFGFGRREQIPSSDAFFNQLIELGRRIVNILDKEKN